MKISNVWHRQSTNTFFPTYFRYMIRNKHFPKDILDKRMISIIMIIFLCILISPMKLNYALQQECLFSKQLSTCLLMPGKRLRRPFTPRKHHQTGRGFR